MRAWVLLGVMGTTAAGYMVIVPSRDRGAVANVAADVAHVVASASIGDSDGLAAADAVARYDAAQRGGKALEMCAQAQRVAVAFLQAKDDASYRTWKQRERVDCAKAGIPAP